ncbi:MAG: extracellular solute-binding protein [Kiritimatiellae bacterium]|nr:extracellular solute-binding protein [Kiritimatiellia bacterium]
MSQLRFTKYERVANAIRDRIVAGRLGRGEKIASEKDLAEEFGMARMTVRQGVELLVSEGWLVRAGRRGTFVSEHPGLPQSTPDDLGMPHFLSQPHICLRVRTDDVQAHQHAFWRAAFERFAEAKPGLSAELAGTARAGNSTVSGDLITTHDAYIPHHIERGLIRPLADPSADPSVLPCFRASASHGVPFSVSTSMLSVNVDLLARAGLGEQPLPATFEQFVRMLGDLKTRLPGVKLVGALPSFACRLAWNEALNTREGQRCFPERVRPVFRALLNLGLDRLEIGERALPRFVNGECVFAMTQPQSLDWMRLGRTFRLACLPLPCLPDARLAYSARVLCVSADSAQPEQAGQLAHFLARREQQALLVSHRAGLPAYGDALDRVTDEQMPGAEATKIAVRAGAHDGAPSAPKIEYVGTVFIHAAQRILTGAVGLEDGLAELARQTERLHRGEIGWSKAGREPIGFWDKVEDRKRDGVP